MRVGRDIGPWSIVPEWVLDLDITDRAVRLYALLGRYADANGESFASRKKLAERLRCSTDSVDRAVSELVKAQALALEQRRRADGGRTSNLYTLLTIPPLQRGSRTGAEGGSRNGAEGKNENHKERETPIAAAPRKKIPKEQRDGIWDALTDIFGPVTTRTAETLRGKNVTELAEAGATGEEVKARASRWFLHYEAAEPTERAIVKHWDTLPQPPRRRR